MDCDNSLFESQLRYKSTILLADSQNKDASCPHCVYMPSLSKRLPYAFRGTFYAYVLNAFGLI